MKRSKGSERIRVKICGLSTLEDARFVAGALADYIGFIFYEKSPRYIEPAKAGAIVNWIEGPECVGVFVNHAPDDVNDIVRSSGMDLVQLHGNESPEYCSLMEKPVIKTFHVGPEMTEEDLTGLVAPYRDQVDYLLFDTKSSSQWGGTGKTFDWAVVQRASLETPFFLSGGLSTGNVLEACRTVHPFAVDLSSGVEEAPGRKDYDKIEQLFDRMREVEELRESGEW